MFKRSYLEQLLNDTHLKTSDIETEIIKARNFTEAFDSDNFEDKMVANEWIRSLTIMTFSDKTLDREKDECHELSNLILQKLEENEMSNERRIPNVVKEEVRKRYKNRCAACKSKESLHFHHITRFSEGGAHSLDNLILLCHECHAKEHEGERGGALLRGGLSTKRVTQLTLVLEEDI